MNECCTGNNQSKLHQTKARSVHVLIQTLQHCQIGLVALLSAGISFAIQPRAAALDLDAVLLLTEPLDIPAIAAYRQGQVPADGSIVTENTISQSDLTIPSLWWAEEQFGGKLLDYWVAYQGSSDTLRRIDLLVSQPVWVRYNYLEQYAFLHHFGTTARDFGYSIRVFNWQGDLLAAYLCDFTPLQSATAPFSDSENSALPSCSVFLDSTGAGALSGTTSPLSPLPINDGID
ncbi:MAG: hypothetical protein Kow00121_00260 [Elainellaceae cyanobacterium]